MKNESIKSKGSAITEAIIIIPVLLTILYGLYYVWRVSIIASNTTVAVRSEIMLHSLAVNSSDNLNNVNWIYGNVGFSKGAKFYCETLGMFPGVAAKDIKIDFGPQNNNTTIPNVYDVMRKTMIGPVYVSITVPLPALRQPFVNTGTDNQKYTARGICEVNPWALNQKQFFGATLAWVEGMRTGIPGVELKEPPTILHNVSPLEGLPQNQGGKLE